MAYLDFIEGAEIRMIREALETHIKLIDKKLLDGRCDFEYWLSEKKIFEILYDKICKAIENY